METGEEGELGLGVPFAWRRRRREATAIRVFVSLMAGHPASPLGAWSHEPVTVRTILDLYVRISATYFV